MTVYKALGLSSPRFSNRAYGVEIELVPKRGTNSINIKEVINNNPAISAHEDGSLPSNGVEFVTRVPKDKGQTFKDVTKLIDEVWGNYDIQSYVGAGVHVHANVLTLTAKELLFFLLFYYSMEESVLGKVPPGRKGNLFCQSANAQAYSVKNFIDQLFLGKLPRFQPTGSGHDRYMALNLAAIEKYGSVELRFLPTVEDADEQKEFILSALGFLEALYEAAGKAQTIPELKALIKDIDGFDEEFFDFLVGDNKNVPSGFSSGYGMFQVNSSSIRAYEEKVFRTPSVNNAVSIYEKEMD